MVSAASLSLLKGGKKSVSQELADEPVEETQTTETEEAGAPVEEEVTVDVDTMDAKQIDELVKEHKIDTPVEWKKMKVGEKRAWLKEQFEETSTDEAGEEKAEEKVEEAKPDPKKDKADKAPAAKASSKEVTTTKSGEVQSPGDDVISDLIFEAENLKEKDARAMVGLLSDQQDEMFFKLGGVLSVIQVNNWFQPYSSFREFVENEHGMNYRKAVYAVAIYNALAESKVPWAKVAKIGWTKLKEIAQVLTLENVDEWVEVAEKNTTLQLTEIVKNSQSKANGGTGAIEDGTAKTVTTKTFKVHEEQKANIEAAISKAKDQSGTAVDTVALEYICMDFLGGQTIEQKLKSLGIEKALELVEKAFPNATINVELGEDE